MTSVHPPDEPRSTAGADQGSDIPAARSRTASHAAVHTLTRWQSSVLAPHLVRLSADDRRLRFGAAMSDEALERYVLGIEFSRDRVFGVYSPDLTLIGMAHLAIDPAQRFAELGLSVDPAYRGKGLGYALLQRAILNAANSGCRTLFMHCLAENAIMIHLARKAGLKVVIERSEAAARMALDKQAHGGVMKEIAEIQVALVDLLFKQQSAWLLNNCA